MADIQLLGPNQVLSNTTPAAPGGSANVTWQGDGEHVSASVPTGAGGVTSVALTMPAEFTVAGSPVTTIGTLAVTKANETANTVFAGPVSGGAAAPTFRFLVAADITTLTGSWTPVLNFGGATTGITYSTQVGDYARVGNIVIAKCNIALSSKGSATGAATITGLPFTVNTSSGASPAATIAYANGFTGLASPAIYASGTTLTIIQLNTGTANSLLDTNFTNTSNIQITVVYFV